jgi:hypothetical protein
LFLVDRDADDRDHEAEQHRGFAQITEQRIDRARRNQQQEHRLLQHPERDGEGRALAVARQLVVAVGAQPCVCFGLREAAHVAPVERLGLSLAGRGLRRATTVLGREHDCFDFRREIAPHPPRRPCPGSTTDTPAIDPRTRSLLCPACGARVHVTAGNPKLSSKNGFPSDSL